MEGICNYKSTTGGGGRAVAALGAITCGVLREFAPATPGSSPTVPDEDQIMADGWINS